MNQTQKQQNKADAFNHKYNIGDRVIVRDDNGQEFEDSIKAKATVMGGHTAMAWLENNGSYLLERVLRKM